MKVVKTLMAIASGSSSLFTFEETTNQHTIPEDDFQKFNDFKYSNDEKSSLSFLINLSTKTTKTCHVVITTFRDNENMYVDTELYQAYHDKTVESKTSVEEFIEADFEELLVYLLQKLDE
jgi:hypothetical protein